MIVAVRSGEEEEREEEEEDGENVGSWAGERVLESSWEFLEARHWSRDDRMSVIFG